MSQSMLNSLAGALREAGMNYDSRIDSEKNFYRYLIKAVLDRMKELPKEIIDKGLLSTAVFHDIKGSALTVNRAKMQMRYQAIIEAILNEK